MLKRKQQSQSGVPSAEIGKICGRVLGELTLFFVVVMTGLLPILIFLAEGTVWQLLLTFVWGVIATLMVLNVKEMSDDMF